MMKKLILFDFDYTLGDSTEGILKSTYYAMEKLGYQRPEREAVRKTIGLTLENSFLQLEPEGTIQESLQYRDYFAEKADEVIVESTFLYDGVLEVLENLKQTGYFVGVVTTKHRYRIEDIFKKFHGEKLLDFIVGGDCVKEKKPAPEGIYLALEHFHCDKEQVLYVGDSLVDANTAKNAGVDFAAVLTGTTTKQEFMELPNVLIGETVMDVYRYIKDTNK